MYTLILENLYHIGTLNINDRTSHNFEGKGLSVSIHPREWLSIARGQISGTPHLLSKKGAIFAVMDESDHETLVLWGLKKNYIKEVKGYSYIYFDDDLGYELENIFETLEEAREEELTIDDLTLKTLYKSTMELKNTMKPIDVFDFNPFQSLFGLYI